MPDDHPPDTELEHLRKQLAALREQAEKTQAETRVTLERIAEIEKAIEAREV